MIVVGLTGGIGAGKSFVANQFIKRGIPVYNSDARGKELMETDTSIKNELIKKFGVNAYINNVLNRKLIADKVFTNKALLDWLNSIIHPAVQTDFESWIKKQKAPFVIKEAAILIESGAYKNCDKIIVVTASEKERIARVVLRDNLADEQVLNRIKNQMNETERLKFADFVIENEILLNINEQIEDVYAKIINVCNETEK